MLGRLGCKSGAGYYRYPDGEPVADPEAERICAALGRAHGIARRTDITDAEIIERLVFPLINEAAKLLEEGMACRPGDIDMVWTAGYGFPDYLGGPVWQADSIGLPRVKAGLERYARLRGNPYDYWDISPCWRRWRKAGSACPTGPRRRQPPMPWHRAMRLSHYRRTRGPCKAGSSRDPSRRRACIEAKAIHS